MAVVGKLGELLISQGLINQDQLAKASAHRSKNKGRLSSSLIELGHVNEKVLATFLSQQYGIQCVSLDGVKIPDTLTTLIPQNICEKNMLIPLSVEGGVLTIAVSDPTNVSAVDDIRFLCKMEVSVFISTESAIKAAIKRGYEKEEAAGADLEKEMADLTNLEQDDKTGTSIEIGQLEKDKADIDSDLVGQKPVIRLINKLFIEALHRKCSDIHIEPFETHTRVRFRIDGSLHEVMRLPRNYVPPFRLVSK